MSRYRVLLHKAGPKWIIAANGRAWQTDLSGHEWEQLACYPRKAAAIAHADSIPYRAVVVARDTVLFDNARLPLPRTVYALL